jgi:uncharacterized membrane protein YgcG
MLHSANKLLSWILNTTYTDTISSGLSKRQMDSGNSSFGGGSPGNSSSGGGSFGGGSSSGGGGAATAGVSTIFAFSGWKH